jgi:DNA-binding NtrC family response regulator
MLSFMLMKRGHEVTALEDGFQTDNMLGKTTFDIIFLDSNTGGIRDIGLIPQIKKKCPDCHIILISSKRGDGFVRDAMCNGAYGCVAKPFNPDEVLTIVKHLTSFPK